MLEQKSGSTKVGAIQGVSDRADVGKMLLSPPFVDIILEHAFGFLGKLAVPVIRMGLPNASVSFGGGVRERERLPVVRLGPTGPSSGGLFDEHEGQLADPNTPFSDRGAVDQDRLTRLAHPIVELYVQDTRSDVEREGTNSVVK